ncbi:MAG: sulfite exporter TauE/SafE family protein [Kiritimatiellales bacterium]
MDPLTAILIFGVIVLITHLLEGITGFGCTVLALPFAVMLLGLETAVPVLVVLAWLLSTYIVLTSRKHIQWKQFAFIAVYAGIGLPVGMILFGYLPESALKMLLGFFMIGVGVRGFIKTLHTGYAVAAGQDCRSIWMKLVLVSGGIIHGAFGSGGPFVVIYAGRALPDKSLFRVTLCMLWTILNTILMIKWTAAGDVWSPAVFKIIGISLPFLIAGTLIGDWLHHRVNERLFRLAVYGVLFLAGVAMLYGVLSPQNRVEQMDDCNQRCLEQHGGVE